MRCEVQRARSRRDAAQPFVGFARVRGGRNEHREFVKQLNDRSGVVAGPGPASCERPNSSRQTASRCCSGNVSVVKRRIEPCSTPGDADAAGSNLAISTIPHNQRSNRTRIAGRGLNHRRERAARLWSASHREARSDPANSRFSKSHGASVVRRSQNGPRQPVIAAGPCALPRIWAAVVRAETPRWRQAEA